MMQMSRAWSELDNATSAEPSSTESIKAAIRQARPFEELKAQVKVAESFLASLERGAERQHAQHRKNSAAQQGQAKVAEAKTAVPRAQQSPGKHSPGKQSPGKQKKIALLEPTQQVEAPHQAKPTLQAVAAEQPQKDPQQPESPEVPEAPHRLSPELFATVQTNAAQAQALAQPLQAAFAPALQSDPQLPSQLPPVTAPVHSLEEDDTMSSPKQQRDPPQHAADHNADLAAETAAAAAAAAVTEDSHISTSTAQSTELAKGTVETAVPSLPADSTSMPENVPSSSKSTEVKSQPVLSSSQSSVRKAASSQAGGTSSQEADEVAASAATHAASAASTSFAPAAAAAPAPAAAAAPAPEAAAAPAAGPGSMQDFLSFLLPAENPSAASAMSSRATPLPAPSSRSSPTKPTESAKAGRQGLMIPPMVSAWGQGGSGQPQAQATSQPSRRVKPYTTTARAPAAPYRPPNAAPYRPPGAVYDPIQAESRHLGQGMHHRCLPAPQAVPEHQQSGM